VTDGFSGSMEDIADALHLLLQDYRFETLHIVAHSMGGAAGLLLADRHDLPVASFVNIEGNLVASDCGILSRSVAEMSSAQLMKDGLEVFLDRYSKSRDPAVHQWLTWTRNTDLRAFHANAASLVAWSDGGELLDIFRQLPLTKSYFYGQRTANSDLLPRLVGIPTRRFDGCGHFPMIEQPTQFCQALEAILTEAKP
jgi:pimeloyl-ACP methyl ester carboxylesterase